YGSGGSGGSTTDGPSCGGQMFTLMPAPSPNMLLVLDKSGSMGQIVASDNNTKWNDVRMAITQLVTQDQQIRFGLMLFSSDGNCGAGLVNVPIGPGTGAMVSQILAGILPSGSTPTAVTLQAADGVTALHDPMRGNFVLLATDGLPNCGAADGPTLAAVQTLAQAQIKTFVIGFGADTQANPQLLNQMAQAGGTARPGATSYYQVNNLSELQMAIQAISGSIVRCTYRLDRPPPDTTQLYVAFDNVLVSQDPVNGWTYDAAGPSLTFHGMACDRLRSGMVMSVAVQYGCPPVR
ncbi:MAG TPA: vWA domain-containing protein, partial [Polyangia bacterium]|nr:vWA domain-containing protein [Polyangia bacterium]